MAERSAPVVVTVTPNPSLDRALDVGRLQVGEVNRATGVHVHPGGKGTNVSRVLVGHGIGSVAVLPVGGPDGEQLVDLLGEQDVPCVPVAVDGDTRSNITVVDATGSTTKINAPGQRLDPVEVKALLGAVEAELTVRPGVVVGAGSLPTGTAEDFYVTVAELGARHGVPVALDTSGPPLEHAVRAGGLWLVKPNDEELAALVGRDLLTVGDVVDAAHEVLRAGNDAVLVSLGAHGALLVTPDGSWWAGGSPLVPLSTVGAGDATLAGYIGTAGTPEERLRVAVAWGRAAVLCPGTAVPGPADVDVSAVRVVQSPDPSLTLKEL